MFLDDVKEHVFNFALRLPSQLPSSFEGEFGHIKYSASVFLIVPRGFEEKCTESFTVIRTVDLNHYPSLQVIYFVLEFHLVIILLNVF